MVKSEWGKVPVAMAEPARNREGAHGKHWRVVEVQDHVRASMRKEALAGNPRQGPAEAALGRKPFS